MVAPPANRRSTFHSVCASGKVGKVRFAPDPLNDATAAPRHLAASTFGNGSRCSVGNELCIWAVPSNEAEAEVTQPLAKYSTAAQSATDFCFVSESELLASLDNGNVEVFRWDENALSRVHQFESVHKFSASCLAKLSGQRVATGGEDGRIKIVDLKKRTFHPLGENGLSSVFSLATYGQSQLLSGHLTGRIHLWDVRSSPVDKPELSINAAGSQDGITSLAVHPAQHSLLALGTRSGSVGFCDLRQADRALPVPLNVANGPVWEVKFHSVYPDNFFNCAEDGSMLHWDAMALKSRSLSSRTLPAEPDLPGEEGWTNVWLMGAALSDNVKLTNVFPKQTLSINSFDIQGSWLIAASDSDCVHVLENVLLT